MRCMPIRLLAAAVVPAAFVVTSPAYARAPCETDAALESAGFRIHPSAEFEHVARGVLERFLDRGDDFVYDTWGPIRSRYGDDEDASLKLFSYDDITTPESDQYGDIVLVFAFDPEGHDRPVAMPWTRVSARKPEPLVNRLVEVRWWEDSQRRVIYDATRVRCATHSIPMALNALF